MAYSNYGAYVWKNGEFVTQKYCDKSFYWNKKYLEMQDEDWEKVEEHFGGHAVIILDDNYALEFYKYNLKIFDKGKEVKTVNVENEILKKSEFVFNKKISIIGYAIDNCETIIEYDIIYKTDRWCVIIGSSFGNGWDTENTSKFIKKNLKYDDGYYMECEEISYGIEKQIRKDEIAFTKYNLWRYGIKPFLKELLKFRIDTYYLSEIKTYLIRWYYLS